MPLSKQDIGICFFLKTRRYSNIPSIYIYIYRAVQINSISGQEGNKHETRRVFFLSFFGHTYNKMKYTYTAALMGASSQPPKKTERKKPVKPKATKEKPKNPIPSPPVIGGPQINSLETASTLPQITNPSLPKIAPALTSSFTPITAPLPTKSVLPTKIPAPVKLPKEPKKRTRKPKPEAQTSQKAIDDSSQATQYTEPNPTPESTKDKTDQTIVSPIENKPKQAPKKRGRKPKSETTLKGAVGTTKEGRKRATEPNEEGGRKKSKSNQSLPLTTAVYELSAIIEGHTEINIPVRGKDELEDAKDIWCCEFEPKHVEGTSDIIALAGSYSVLFMDAQQGRYIKKYTHPEDQEIFYCMAWTTVQLEGEVDANCNVLAVAGRLGSIKLMNPLQHECYRYLFGHRQAVLKLAFAKSEPQWLFSASADNTVRLWDIGSPTSRVDDSMCLAKFNLPSKAGIPSALSISYDLSTLMVGCDNGDMVRYSISDKDIQKIREKATKGKNKDLESNEKWFNALSFQPNIMYPEGDEWHSGYVDDICILGQDGNSQNGLNGKIISRGANDWEIILWDPAKSTQKDAEVEKSFDWPDSAECTGLRFKVIEKEGNIFNLV
ncbi:WD40-repeat-containing domain protein [Gilbertella persicaria]|uniref:WD40-repeat-containing domain protein n=1 Tax=Gilbertella persicaria TaxID=101096 RepID=UPI0022200EAD|nr:WD40-repeat-containing domain protein [Gilbertella persicaria]KAI8062353.1 WD40-repeat-containing domain protein [Gilbertella persicaria]